MLPLEGINLGPLLPEHVSELVVGLVLFAIIWFVVAKMVMPSFEDLYDKRTAQTRGAIEEAERKQAEAEAALVKYNAQLAQAGDEAARIRDDARQQAVRLRDEASQKAKEDADRIAATNRAQIEADKVHALADLQGEIGGLATTLAGKILNESLTDDERARRVVDRFLADLDQQTAKA